jgi:hypothetical protein
MPDLTTETPLPNLEIPRPNSLLPLDDLLTEMAPIELVLPRQTLIDAMLQLERCEDPEAVLAFKMAESGNFYLLNEEKLKFLRHKTAISSIQTPKTL